ncbi:MAG: thioredoxin domain-containing protein [Thermoanaerobaculia bacterium]
MRIVRATMPLVLIASLRALGQGPDAPCPVVRTEALPPCDAPAARSTLATLDGTKVTASDLDEAVRKRIDGLDAAVAEARRKALDAEVDDTLLRLEAERRKVSFRDLWESEVLRKTPPPTEESLRLEYEDWKKWYPDTPFEDLRNRLVSVVRDANREKREAEFARSLRGRFPVAPGLDPSAQGLARDAVLATVGDRKITRGSAATRLEAAAYGARSSVYYAERSALEALVTKRLIKAEAEKRGISPEALRNAEVDDRILKPTDEEVAKEWEEWGEKTKGGLEAARSRVAASLEKQRKAALEDELDKKLRSGRAIKVDLPAPASPVLEINLSGAASRGPSDAPVTLVEFADFECPHCGKMWPIVEEALEPYGARVRYVFRNFPLPFHEFALEAAMAAHAAHRQGRFFELADLLFANQKTLTRAHLVQLAAKAGLDADRFSRDLQAGGDAADVLLEKREGERIGVQGTPMLFVNGVFAGWEVHDVAGIRAVLDAAFAKASGTALAPAVKAATP